MYFFIYNFSFGFRDSLAEDREAQRVLCAQVLQILEENGIETEALVNAFNTARNQSSSDTEVQYGNTGCGVFKRGVQN